MHCFKIVSIIIIIIIIIIINYNFSCYNKINVVECLTVDVLKHIFLKLEKILVIIIVINSYAISLFTSEGKKTTNVKLLNPNPCEIEHTTPAHQEVHTNKGKRREREVR